MNASTPIRPDVERILKAHDTTTEQKVEKIMEIINPLSLWWQLWGDLAHWVDTWPADDPCIVMVNAGMGDSKTRGAVLQKMKALAKEVGP
jgi:hypothetical protein